LKNHVALTLLGGSLGDLHPMMGLAGELKKREHDATIATIAYHRSAAEKAGFGFHEIAPNLDPHRPRTHRRRSRHAEWTGAPAQEGSLMPRARCIVHAGGVGTTAQAMRSGRPMLVVPSCNDQLDHADHVRRLGIAREVHQKCLTVGRAARELERLLSEPSFGRRAESVASQLSREKRCHRRRGRPRTGLRLE